MEGVPWDLAQGVRQRVALLPEAGAGGPGGGGGGGAAARRGRCWRRSAGQPEEAVLAGLEAACRARLLLEEGDDGYAFAHDLIREVVEAELGAARRAVLHRRVAEALEGDPGSASPELLAYHYGRGGARTRPCSTWSGRATMPGASAPTAPRRATTARRWRAWSGWGACTMRSGCARSWARCSTADRALRRGARGAGAGCGEPTAPRATWRAWCGSRRRWAGRTRCGAHRYAGIALITALLERLERSGASPRPWRRSMRRGPAAVHCRPVRRLAGGRRAGGGAGARLRRRPHPGAGRGAPDRTSSRCWDGSMTRCGSARRCCPLAERVGDLDVPVAAPPQSGLYPRPAGAFAAQQALLRSGAWRWPNSWGTPRGSRSPWPCAAGSPC